MRKGYSMTGWRLGYGVMPTSLTDAMTTLVINNVSWHCDLRAVCGESRHSRGRRMRSLAWWRTARET